MVFFFIFLFILLLNQLSWTKQLTQENVGSAGTTSYISVGNKFVMWHDQFVWSGLDARSKQMEMPWRKTLDIEEDRQKS